MRVNGREILDNAELEYLMDSPPRPYEAMRLYRNRTGCDLRMARRVIRLTQIELNEVSEHIIPAMEDV